MAGISTDEDIYISYHDGFLYTVVGQHTVNGLPRLYDSSNSVGCNDQGFATFLAKVSGCMCIVLDW